MAVDEGLLGGSWTGTMGGTVDGVVIDKSVGRKDRLADRVLGFLMDVLVAEGVGG